MRKILVTAAVLIMMLLAACAPKPAPTPEQPKQEMWTRKGFSISPVSFEAAHFRNFFQTAKQAGDIITWSGDWAYLRQDGTAPETLMVIAGKFNVTPIVMAAVADNGKPLRSFDQANNADYVRKARDFASAYKPDYLGLGVEVNLMGDDDIDAFAKVFSESAAAVRNVSPRTKLFTVFQLERMNGWRGGLYGGENNFTKYNQWTLLTKFPDADLYAFTAYPGLVFKDPDELPEDYLEEIRNHVDRPIAFTELGWFREGPQGWESSDEEQGRFVAKFISLAKPIKPVFTIWTFLYDQDVQKPFNTMGLLQAGQNSSQAWQAWMEK